MSLPVFAESIIKCDAVLKHHGIDIMHILTVDDPNIFDNVINCFVGITVIQVTKSFSTNPIMLIF